MPKKIMNPIGYLQHLLLDLNPAEAVADGYRPGLVEVATRAAEEALAEL